MPTSRFRRPTRRDQLVATMDQWVPSGEPFWGRNGDEAGIARPGGHAVAQTAQHGLRHAAQVPRAQGGGGSLRRRNRGPVGERFVAEATAGIQGDKQSYVSHDPDWTPHAPSNRRRHGGRGLQIGRPCHHGGPVGRGCHSAVGCFFEPGPQFVVAMSHTRLVRSPALRPFRRGIRFYLNP